MLERERGSLLGRCLSGNAAVAFYPASSSVVRSAKPVANVVKSSRRQCMRAAGDERFGEAPVGEELIGTLACECGDRMDL